MTTPNKKYLTWGDITTQIDVIVQNIKEAQTKWDVFTEIYGLPRGGLIPGVMLSHALEIPMILDKNAIWETTIIIDDIIDSGETLTKITISQKAGFTSALVYKTKSTFIPDGFGIQVEGEEWIVFPWETEASSKYDYTQI